MEPLSSWTVGISRLSATLICPRMSWRMGHVRLEPTFSHGSYRMLMDLFALHFKQHGWGILQLLNFLFASLLFILFMCQWFQSCVKGIYLLFETPWHWTFMSKIKSWKKKSLEFYKKGHCFLLDPGKAALSLPCISQLDKTKNRM